MRIALDEQAVQLQRFGGISRYITRLAEELDRGGDEVRVFSPLYCNEYLRCSKVPKSVWLNTSRAPQKLGRVIKSFNRFVTARKIPAWHPDVVHETYYSRRALGRRRLPTVITVHDMIFERFPDMFADGGRASREKALALARADHVICVSEATRRDLCDLFQFPVEKTSVVHHGVDAASERGAASGTLHVGRPFLLYVGGLRDKYKNFAGLLRAVAQSPLLGRGFDIVAFGGPPLSVAEREAAAELGLSSAHLRYAGCEESKLPELYRTAAALVYPSLYEGFGMPLLEAMAHDCPVVTGCHGPFPEVCGNAAEYFEVGMSSDISRAIEAVVFSPSRRNELVQRGRERAAVFTWQRCASATRDAYLRAMATNN